ncbi:uncharacterized protein LOC129580752 [Paramacrobiotus metropolitanus]|uniref:uncharacterized protein LOC129580752 n=1 Tax=Paramacrobiotus metropolitanus TaxID=2943436 RepID=UPI0024456679|nr:uncharacterized protein LOC129580752 [Paramacrobiotus metropolitanus]
MGEYVWVSHYSKLTNVIPLQIYSGTEPCHLLEVVREKLERDGMPDVFLNFLLTCGHTSIISLHYRLLVKTVGHVPALLLCGPRNTGKSLNANVSTSFCGANAQQICIYKDMTLTRLRERYTEDHFPIIVHDAEDESLVATALMECYEARPVLKHNSNQTPGTTIWFTCNEKTISMLRKNFASLSRAVVIPMLVEFKSATREEFRQIAHGRETASQFFEAILNLTNHDIEELMQRMHELRYPIKAAMPILTDSHNRIVDGYAMLVAATEMFVKKCGWDVWATKIEGFVMQQLLPVAQYYYEYTAETTIGPSLAILDRALQARICEVIHKIRGAAPDELKKCFAVTSSLPYVAFREQDFTPLMNVHADSCAFDFSDLKKLPGTVNSHPVGISGKVQRAICVLKSHFTDEELEFLSARTSSLPGAVMASMARLGKKAVQSPFKSAQATRLPATFIPSHTSTQLENLYEGTQTDIQSRQVILPDVSAIASDSGSTPSEPQEPAIQEGMETLDDEKSPDRNDEMAPPPGLSVGSRSLFSQSGETSEMNATFRVSSEPVLSRIPAGSKEVDGLLDVAVSSDGMAPKRHKPKKSPCCPECKGFEEAGKPLPVYKCKQCQQSYHMKCQVTHPVFWPERTKCQTRLCNSCRKIL